MTTAYPPIYNKGERSKAVDSMLPGTKKRRAALPVARRRPSHNYSLNLSNLPGSNVMFGTDDRQARICTRTAAPKKTAGSSPAVQVDREASTRIGYDPRESPLAGTIQERTLQRNFLTNN